MKYTKLTNNGDNTFNVVDTRTGKTVKRNLKGSKAIAYRAYVEEQIAEAELFWSKAV